MKRAMLGGLAAIWLAALGIGARYLYAYETKAGQPGTTENVWPQASELKFQPGKPTLLFWVHPACPCTRASLAELNKVASRTIGKANIRIVVLEPEGLEKSDHRSDLWRLIRDIPGAEVTHDPGGKEADRFGVKTSGHTLVFSSEGQLLFSGGITSMRGHEGSNPGSRAVLDHLSGRDTELTSSNVYGCPLSSHL